MPIEFLRISAIVNTDAFPRGVLEDTVRALSQCEAPQSALIELIEAILAGPIISKPERHHGGEDSDFLSVNRVNKEEAAAIADVFLYLLSGIAPCGSILRV